MQSTSAIFDIWLRDLRRKTPHGEQGDASGGLVTKSSDKVVPISS